MMLNVALNYLRFQVLSAANMKMTAFWDIVLYSLIEGDQHFRGEYSLHHCPWRQYTPLKHWSVSTVLHCAISEKAVFLAEFLETIVICTCADVNICLVLCVQLTEL
jgi:hypothetical protein